MILWFLFVIITALAFNFLAYSIHGAYVSDNDLLPLPDKLFSVIRQRELGFLFYFFVDYVPVLMILLFLGFDWSKSKDKKRLAATFIASLTTLANFKNASVQLTGIPPPYEFPLYMQTYELELQNKWKKNDFPIRGNADMIFSGHTSVTLFTLLLTLRQCSVLDSIPYILLFVMFLFGIITTRFHYSMDIMVAIIISTMVYLIAIRFINSTGTFFSSELFKINVLSVVLASISTMISLLTYSCDWTSGICIFKEYAINRKLNVASVCPAYEEQMTCFFGFHP